MKSERMQRTRQEILGLLRRRKSAKVEELAQALGLVPMTIRQHLTVLERDGFVTHRECRRGAGRPYHAFSLTEGADALFPKHYDVLARLMLQESKEVLGEAVVVQICQRIAGKLAAGIAPRMAGHDLPGRLEELTAILTEMGMMARLEKSDSRYLLTNDNCPYREVARDNPQVCYMDRSFITQALGVPVEMEARIAAGDPSCRFWVRAS